MQKKIIAQSLWIGGQLSDMEKLAISSHLRQGHEFHLYCYNSIEGVPEGAKIKDANEILPESEVFAYQVGPGKGSYSAFSNYFRYKLVRDKGNWWVDTDVVALKPWDFDEEYVFGSEVADRKQSYTSVSSCVFKTPAGATIMDHCWKRCCEQDRSTLEWGVTGPILITEGVMFHDLNDSVVPTDYFCPIDWPNYKWFLNDQEVPNTYGIHLWHEMWRRDDIDRDAEWPNTLYGRLKNDFLC